MTHTYTALIQQRGEWWVGRIQEIPSVNCQEKNARRIVGYTQNNPRRNTRNQPRGSH